MNTIKTIWNFIAKVLKNHFDRPVTDPDQDWIDRNW
jgi:hypothetical protein